MTTPSPRRNSNPRRPRPSLVIGAALATTLLAGCLGTPGPTPPAGAPRALVYGAVGSPIYAALGAHARMTVSNGSQKATDYDLVVVDGDSFTADQLKGDRALHGAISAGVWVLGLDLDEDDKTGGLGASFHGATPGRSPAYMARQALRGDGHLLNIVIDFARHPGTAEEQARQVARYLNTPELKAQQGPSNVPAGVLTVDYRVIDASVELAMPANNNPVFKGTPQVANWQANHYISVYMDAGTNPQGDFQHVVVETDGWANPNGLSINNINSVPWNDDESEIAYIQTMFQSNHSIAPDPGADPDQVLGIQQTSPQNVNNVTNVTTGFSFNIGFSADGDSESFGYNYSVTQNITDWGLTNTSTQGGAGYSFYSQRVYKGQQTSGFDDSAWFYWPYHVAPQTPTQLSLSNYQYTALTHWQNNAVYNGWVTVSGTDNGWYTDAWVVNYANDNNPNGNAPHCVVLCGCEKYGGCSDVQHMLRYNVPKPWAFRINMGVVIPVGISSVTFDPPTVVAGRQTTATVTLDSPTPIPATVYVSSDRPGVAAPYGNYVVPAGASSVSFPIITGAQGNCEESATISAVYADSANGVLNIQPPPGANCP